MEALLFEEATLEGLSERIADSAASTVPTASCASVVFAGDGAPRTVGATADEARQLDAVQHDSDTGPCLDAMRHIDVVVADVVDDAARWPAFCARAVELGITGAVSVPLSVRDIALGTINVYRRAGARFAPDECTALESLARAAAVLLSNLLAYSSSETRNEQLVVALQTREIIGQAMGVLMERESCGREAAFDMLRRASQRENVKLRDLAERIVAGVEDRGAR